MAPAWSRGGISRAIACADRTSERSEIDRRARATEAVMAYREPCTRHGLGTAWIRKSVVCNAPLHLRLHGRLGDADAQRSGDHIHNLTRLLFNARVQIGEARLPCFHQDAARPRWRIISRRSSAR
jgi:hypothetical protein